MTTTTIRLKQLSAALFVCGLVSCGGAAIIQFVGVDIATKLIPNSPSQDL